MGVFRPSVAPALAQREWMPVWPNSLLVAPAVPLPPLHFIAGRALRFRVEGLEEEQLILLLTPVRLFFQPEPSSRW